MSTTKAPSQHKPLPLMGTTEAAHCLGIRPQNLLPKDPQTKRGIGGLPEPVAELEAGRVWWGPDIEAFAEIYAERKRSSG